MQNILSVSHIRQSNEGYCLPACAQMVLAYSGLQTTQIELAQQLETIPHIGTPGFRIRLLASRRLEVIYRSGELADLRRALSEGVPPIVMVDTGELPYWEVATTHAVVLLAIDKKTVFLNDPDKEQAPIRVSLDDFELGASRMCGAQVRNG